MKRRRIKNRDLKHRHLWPRLLTMLIMFALFLGLLVGLLNIMLQIIVGSKILKGYDEAKKVVAICENSGNEYNRVKDIYNLKSVFSEISTVCLVDENNNIIEQYGKEVPDFDKERSLDLFGENLTLIIDTDKEFIDKDGDFIINLNNLVKPEDFSRIVFQGDSLDYDWMSRKWIGFKCWFITDNTSEDGRVCVNGEIVITMYEIVCIVGAFAFVTIIAFIYFIWKIIELIKMFAEHRRAYRLLHSDLVTGGNNKHMFVETCEHLLKWRRHRQYAVVQLRLEKYRNYCMYYGEEAGEQLLYRIYDVLDEMKHRKEFIFHESSGVYGLLLLCDNYASLSYRLTNLISDLEQLQPGQKLYYTVGVSQVTESNDVTVYFNEAGTARATIKEDDENRVVWFNEAMRAAQIWERKVENDMERALNNHEFQVYLQPKYSTSQEKLSGAEALVRWIHPTEGFVPPGKFIPIFEKNGFILKLDDFMITEVAKLQSGWLKEGKQIVPISVNVSRAHFTREDLAEYICGIIDRYNVPHQYIELELTESAFFDDKEVLLKTVRKMKELGFHVSMDDFGAGYSSLNSLKELPLDVVKLDAEFFRGTDDLERANLIVSQTIELAKQLGMTIVAEGIETREQVDFLAGQKCDLIQGFFFAKPMPVSDFEERAFGSADSVQAEEQAENVNPEQSDTTEEVNTDLETN